MRQAPSTAAPAATEQASQAPPLQTEEQQTPSAQKPLWQSLPVAHATPRAERPYRSALAVMLPRLDIMPPATSTSPTGSNVAVCRPRGWTIGLCGDHEPVAGS
jgi:hypothetical protein